MLLRLYILCIVLICFLHYWYCEKPSDPRNYGREENNSVQYESYVDEVDDSESIPETETVHDTVAPTKMEKLTPSVTFRPSLETRAIPRRPKNLTLPEFGKYETNREEVVFCAYE